MEQQEKQLKDWLRSIPKDNRDFYKSHILKYGKFQLTNRVKGPLSDVLLSAILWAGSSVEISHFMDLDTALRAFEDSKDFKRSYPSHIFPELPLGLV